MYFCSCLLCIVVVVLCVFLWFFRVYFCHLICIGFTVCVLLFFTIDDGVLARSLYSEGPATGHLDTNFIFCIHVK